MMLFWILAITDLIMVGITWAVYGDCEKKSVNKILL